VASGTVGVPKPRYSNGREGGLKHRTVWVRIPPGAPFFVGCRWLRRSSVHAFGRHQGASTATARGRVVSQCDQRRARREPLGRPVLAGPWHRLRASASLHLPCLQCTGRVGHAELRAPARLLPRGRLHLADASHVLATSLLRRELPRHHRRRGVGHQPGAPGRRCVPRQGAGCDRGAELLEPLAVPLPPARARTQARTRAQSRELAESARWEFVNHSADIRRWCAETLDLVEVPWRQSSWRCISVSTRAGVARLDALIGLKR
jgi:hypothetical protein